MVFEAIKRGISRDEIHQITMIDPWFLAKLAHLAGYEQRLSNDGLTQEAYLEGKKLGYPDKVLSRISGAADQRTPLRKLQDGRYLRGGV